MRGIRRVILVRYGEISLKGRNRPVFEAQLARRVRYALADLGRPRVERTPGRLLVDPGDADAAAAGDGAGVDLVEEACQRLARVFGVVSLSPALEVPLSIEAIDAAAEAALRAALVDRPGGAPASFKVETNRANKRFPLDSRQINQRLGAHLLQSVPGLRVDVHHPEITVNVDVREDMAYIFTRTLSGPGGLPVGASGRAHLLLSGGIDSPVAGWMAMKRGVDLEAIHFHSPPFTSERARLKVADICRRLAPWGGPHTLHVVHFTEAQKQIYERCPAELGVTIMRRLMLRVAGRIAAARGGLALVTGESLGQVASQTLESINTIDRVADLPVLRPLIGFDKAEIVTLARRIGTYDISVLPYEDCCTVFVPRHPRTRPTPAEAEAAERSLDVDSLVEGALAGVEVEAF